MPIRIPVLFLCLLVARTAAAAQAPVHLTLEAAIARGVEASHRLAEFAARREAANAEADGERASAAPAVSVQAGYLRTNHVTEFSVPDPLGATRVLYPDVPDNLRSRVDLQWPIYTGGRADALERAARAEADALGHDRAAAQADLKLEITRAYWALVTARSTVDVLDQALARADAHLADVRAQLDVGLVPPNDVLSSEAQRARQQMLRIEAGNQADAAAVQLRRLVGLDDPDVPIAIDELLEPPPPLAGAPATAQVEQAREERPERAALTSRIQSARDRQAAAEAARRPSLAVVGGYDYARPNPKIFPREATWQSSWDVGLSLNWSLWDGGRTAARAAQAAATRRAVEERQREFDAALTAEVRQRRLDVSSAFEAITAAEAGVRSAAEARRVVADRFTAGLATNSDVLDVELALTQAELDRTRALAGARLAVARLERALGR